MEQWEKKCRDEGSGSGKEQGPRERAAACPACQLTLRGGVDQISAIRTLETVPPSRQLSIVKKYRRKCRIILFYMKINQIKLILNF